MGLVWSSLFILQMKKQKPREGERAGEGPALLRAPRSALRPGAQRSPLHCPLLYAGTARPTEQGPALLTLLEALFHFTAPKPPVMMGRYKEILLFSCFSCILLFAIPWTVHARLPTEWCCKESDLIGRLNNNKTTTKSPTKHLPIVTVRRPCHPSTRKSVTEGSGDSSSATHYLCDFRHEVPPLRFLL